jgi:hypothetical protein
MNSVLRGNTAESAKARKSLSGLDSLDSFQKWLRFHLAGQSITVDRHYLIDRVRRKFPDYPPQA